MTSTLEWVKTFTDGAGHIIRKQYSPRSAEDGDGPCEDFYYNAQGQMWKTKDADDVFTLYKFDGQGRIEYTVVPRQSCVMIYGYTSYADVDYGYFDPSYHLTTIDRITRNIQTEANSFQQTDIQTWNQDDSDTHITISRSKVYNNGLQSWNYSWTTATDSGNPTTAAVSNTQTVYNNSQRIETTTYPDTSTLVRVYGYGRLASETRRDATAQHNIISQTTYFYDSFGRLSQVTDLRNGATVYAYNTADQVVGVTTPAPGNGQAAQTTITQFDNMMRVWRVIQPDGTSVTNEYFQTGLLKKTYGSRNYPVAYTYDDQGRMKTMITWQNYAGSSGTATNTWNYNPKRGFLDSKVYQDGKGPSYTYSRAGRLVTRTWARNITTTYVYNTLRSNELEQVTYTPNSTPSSTFSYDRLGRMTSVVRDGIATALGYTDNNNPTGETYTGGLLGGFAVASSYDDYGRRDTHTASGNSISSVVESFNYLSYYAGLQLNTVANDTSTATYSYLANSPLISQISFKQSSVARMTSSRQYDYMNRLRSIANTPADTSALPVSYVYNYNDANQRVQSTLADGSFWVYAYDKLGQVISGKRYWSDGTPVPGQQFEYGFDDIGNRTLAKNGGDQNGVNLRSAGYTNNILNQLTSRGVPNQFDVVGAATGNVTVNTTNAAYRKGEYYWHPVGAPNSVTSVWQNVIMANGGTDSPKSGYVYTPSTPEYYTNDFDGNMINDGRWGYDWDGENRLIQMLSLTNCPPESKRWINFTYDWQGRRIAKIVKKWNTTTLTWDTTLNRIFLYDGWNLIAEIDVASNGTKTLAMSYTWGTDLSGSMQGAGGVGGLLFVTKHTGTAASAFVAYDGNGNVVGLVSTADSKWLAHYEYGPFGETIRANDALAKDNPYRFSTKYQDNETDLYYYGYRYYNASTGRWINRDPIEESGGPNLYCFCYNIPIINWDHNGLETQTAAEIAIVMGNRYRPSTVKTGREYCGKICQKCTGENYAGTVAQAERKTPGDCPVSKSKCNKNDKVVAVWHTHPKGYPLQKSTKPDKTSPDTNFPKSGRPSYMTAADGVTTELTYDSDSQQYSEIAVDIGDNY